MWYLLISLTFGNSYPLVVIPEKYPDEIACKDAGGKLSLRYTYACIPAPVHPTCMQSLGNGSSLVISVPCDVKTGK